MVVLHKRPYTQEQFNWIEKQLQDDQLTLNHQKTLSVNMSCLGSEFDFLGFRFKQIKGYYRKSQYIKIEPSQKSQQKYKDKVRQTVKHRTSLTMDELVKRVNRITRGWKNYFGPIGYPNQVFFLLDWFNVKRFYLWSRSRSQRGSQHLTQDAWKKLDKAGLILFKPTKQRPL